MENQEQRRPISPIQAFRSQIEGKMYQEIAKALPKGIDPDRFIRTVITVVQMQPELLSADRGSLFSSCMQAAKDGLLPDGKEATIQVYNTKVTINGQDDWIQKAQYMPMVRGLIKKMYEAGCTKVDSAAVYEKDSFAYLRGDDDRINHAPYLGMDEPGAVIASYAIVTLANGEKKREVMMRRDIEKVRDASKSKNGPGWKNWYDQFAIKAVLKRIYKQLPDRNLELERLFDIDNEVMGFEFNQRGASDTTALTGGGVKAITSQPGKSSRLDSIIGKKEAEPVPASEEEQQRNDDQEQQNDQ